MSLRGDAAPLHQGVEYDPLVQAAGDVYVGGESCMGLGDERPMPESPETYAYLGDEGPRNVPYEIDAVGEGPYAPQQFVDIRQGQPTGPQPILYILGLGVVHAGAWSLQTSSGATVPNVKMVDSAAAAAAGHPGYFPERAWMVPPPLQPATSYSGSVTWIGTAGQVTQDFSFTTVTAKNLLGLYYSENILHAQSEAPGGSIVFSKRGRRFRVQIATRGGALAYERVFRLSLLGPGTWHVCAASGGGTTGYEAKKECLTISIRHHRVV